MLLGTVSLVSIHLLCPHFFAYIYVKPSFCSIHTFHSFYLGEITLALEHLHTQGIIYRWGSSHHTKTYLITYVCDECLRRESYRLYRACYYYRACYFQSHVLFSIVCVSKPDNECLLRLPTPYKSLLCVAIIMRVAHKVRNKYAFFLMSCRDNLYSHNGVSLMSSKLTEVNGF